MSESCPDALPPTPEPSQQDPVQAPDQVNPEVIPIPELGRFPAEDIGAVAVWHTVSAAGSYLSAGWSRLRGRARPADAQQVTTELHGMPGAEERQDRATSESEARTTLLRHFRAPFSGRPEDAVVIHSATPEASRAEQIQKVEQYYHTHLESLTDEQLRAIGLDGAGMRDLVFKAALVKGGVNLGALSVPVSMSEAEVSKLVLRQGELREGRWGVSTRRSVNTREELMGSVREAALDVAIRDVGMSAKTFERVWQRQRGRYAGQVREVFARRDEIAHKLMTDPEMASSLNAYETYIDGLQTRLVTAPSSVKDQQTWTANRVTTAQATLGLTNDEIAQVTKYSILPTAESYSGAFVDGVVNGQPQRTGPHPAVDVNGYSGGYNRYTPGIDEATESLGPDITAVAYVTLTGALSGRNTGLQFSRQRRAADGSVLCNDDGSVVVDREVRTLPADRHSVLNQYVLLGVVKAEEMIGDGKTSL